MIEEEFKRFQESDAWHWLKPKKFEKHINRLRVQMMSPYRIYWLPEPKRIYWDERGKHDK